MPEAAGDDASLESLLAPVKHARRIAVILVVVAAAIASYLHVSGRIGFPFDIVGLVVALLGGWPVWRETWLALRARRVSMEMTMAVGALAALLLGQIATAALVVAFTLLSIYLEDLTRSRGRRAVEALLRVAPEQAHRRVGDAWLTVKVEELRVGDAVRVFPGEKVPADGAVLAGRSHIDESAITGEPYPHMVHTGVHVFAGTLNGNGTLDVLVERRGEDTTYARIVTLVREANQRRGPTQRLADRVATWILLGSLGAAALTWIVTRDPTSALSVILVAGACGVAAGTPLAILATTAVGASNGIVYKGGEAVEALSRADTFVFDKTGTLTVGEPVLARVVPLGGALERELMPFLLAIEQGSQHPVARALLRGHTRPLPDAVEVEELEGRGIRGSVDGRLVLAGNLTLLRDSGIAISEEANMLKAEADTRGAISIFLAIAGDLVAMVELRDTVRPDAVACVEALREGGARILMLTGDQVGPASYAAASMGITEYRAELLPQDKIVQVEALRAEGRGVCFVGDGINDAPALAAADLGVAVRHGSDVAIESADVILMRDDLTTLVDAWRAARRARGVILFNFAATLGVDAIGIALAATGNLGPVPAAIVHLGSELVLIANSARLFASWVEP